MYYNGKTTGKEIIKELIRQIPMFIFFLIMFYLTGIPTFLFDIFTGRTSILYIYNY